MPFSIPLTQGLVAIVDGDDWERIDAFRWQPTFQGGRVYAKRGTPGGTSVYMHRELLGLGAIRRPIIDHADGNGLNNIRTNLRVVSHTQNSRNMMRKKTSRCRFKGVEEIRSLFRARIFVDSTLLNLGAFPTDIEAARAYDEAARKHFGEYAAINFPFPGERSALTGLIEPQVAA